MSLTLRPVAAPRLSAAELAPWAEIPAAIVGDELNRAHVMAAAIRPLADGASFVGEAFTVATMVGDNSPIHHAVALAWPGAVLTIDARGFVDTAVYGGLLHAGAEARRLAAVIVDGAVRDRAELRRSAVPVYARGTVPAGPHKGWGGSIGETVQCGGVAVAPGDVVRGDEDGVVVIPRAALPGLLERCRRRLAHEAETLAQIRAGKTTAELLRLPPPEPARP